METTEVAFEEPSLTDRDDRSSGALCRRCNSCGAEREPITQATAPAGTGQRCPRCAVGKQNRVNACPALSSRPRQQLRERGDEDGPKHESNDKQKQKQIDQNTHSRVLSLTQSKPF